jgi:2-polyprenyl-6-methoxyphenol hydroxylase-like FAD-dependent oxidoreductase
MTVPTLPPRSTSLWAPAVSSNGKRAATMAVGPIALVGDAAFIPRPHTAASTAKAAGNALALVDALKRETDIPAALRAWEPDQIQFGLHLRRQGKLLGDQSQKRYAEPRPT